MTQLACRYRLPCPDVAGTPDKELLKQWAAKYPHLRPCKLRNWAWIYRTECEKCRHAYEVREHE